MTTAVPAQKKDRRLEIRTTARDREVIVQAAASTGRDITSFVSDSAVREAQRILADRAGFVLTPDQTTAWDALMDRPARDIPSLRALLERPSIFVDE